MSRHSELNKDGFSSLLDTSGRYPEGNYVEWFVVNRMLDLNSEPNPSQGRRQEDVEEHSRYGTPDEIDQFLIKRSKEIDY